MNISFHGAAQMGEQERKEAAEERGNFVRMTRILLEGLSVCLRAQFLKHTRMRSADHLQSRLATASGRRCPGKPSKF